ncbi:hypothetical protein O181_062671 [Austropuccinia psidii MF-1]|uniref:Uncharacterized protein n=1 Tax=Austropuccinia psidii MF-1 TaxID=1389203 RepID=A0A9Q3HYM9_9BASI|nr:hypothetical protein [Austropuccinia psidii MF-1]
MALSALSLSVVWLYLAVLALSKLPPLGKICYSYTYGNTSAATCNGEICPYGCSWPYITISNCKVLGSFSSPENSPKICHLGFWKKDDSTSICQTKSTTYQCTGKPSGFAVCTGCEMKGGLK